MKKYTILSVVISIILLLVCFYRYKYDSNQDREMEELSKESLMQPFDFIVLKMKTESTNNVDGYVNLWIKNTKGESGILERTMNRDQIKYQKNGIYYVIYDFKYFEFKDVKIENKEGKIYLNGRNLSDIGNATLSEDGKLEMGTFYRTFH